MATKQQALNKLKKKFPDAKLETFDSPNSFQVQIEAPRGHHFEHDVHCRALPDWFKGSPRSEYWDMVIEEIDDLPPAIPCDDDDCEGIQSFGECEYWEDHDYWKELENS